MKLINQLSLASLSMSLSLNAYAMDRVIIKYKPSATQEYNLSVGNITQPALNKELQKPYTKSRLNSISNITGHKTQEINTIATGAHVISIDGVSSKDELDEIVASLNAESGVQYAIVDKLMQPTGVVNPKQWYLMGTESNPSTGYTYGDNILMVSELLANNSIPDNNVVIAVIDTGYTPHPNFINQLISTGSNKYGYSFISDCRMSGECSPSTSHNYNIAYKVDGLDLGDYLTTDDISSANGYFNGCTTSSSSWHGTHITGIIAGSGYDNVTDKGVLGGASNAKILPLRVLGKCGGYVSDISNAMLWAAGQSNVSNNHGGVLATNTTPADILSLSLGAEGACTDLEQDVINTITANGTNGKIIVVSAGNAGSDVQNYSPANCKNVIRVGAKGPSNQLAFYSNWGDVDIVASGGDSRISNGYIYSTSWGSNTVFDANAVPSYRNMQGTSMAAPNVSASIAGLVSYFKHTNKSWSTHSINSILAVTASDLANPCYTSGRCVKTKSALNAGAAMEYAMNSYQGSLELLTSIPVLFIGDIINLKFKNNNANSLTNGITGLSLNGEQTAITMLQNNCTTVEAGQECEVILQLNSAYDDEVIFKDINGLTIASVDVEVLDSKAASSMSMSSSGGGGGCTMIENGDDYGLIMLILLTSVYGLRRKYFTKSVK